MRETTEYRDNLEELTKVFGAKCQLLVLAKRYAAELAEGGTTET